MWNYKKRSRKLFILQRLYGMTPLGTNVRFFGDYAVLLRPLAYAKVVLMLKIIDYSDAFWKANQNIVRHRELKIFVYNFLWHLKDKNIVLNFGFLLL